MFGRRFDLEHLPWSADHYLKTGETLPANGYQMLREIRRHLRRRAWRPARGRQPARARHPARHALRARSLRQLPARPAARRSPVPAEGSRPQGHQLRRVPREHRRRVCQRRRPLQGRHRRRDRDPGRDQHLQGRAPHHPPRVRVREGERPDEGLHGRQEQRHAAGPRALAARVQGSVGAVSRHHRDASVHRCAGDVPGQGPRAVPGDRHEQPVRRHRHRHRRRAAGRAGHGRVGQHPPGQDVAVRAGARLGAAAGGKERRQPDRRDPLDGADARNARRARRIQGDRAAVEAAIARRPDHVGHRRLARHPRSRRLDREEIQAKSKRSNSTHGESTFSFSAARARR